MPYVIRPPVRRMWVAGLAAALATLALMAPASSKADTLACDLPTLSNPFAAFGDVDSYVLVPDGGFEAGASGWSLSSGADVVSGNENSYVGSSSDSSSLSIKPVIGFTRTLRNPRVGVAARCRISPSPSN